MPFVNDIEKVILRSESKKITRTGHTVKLTSHIFSSTTVNCSDKFCYDSRRTQRGQYYFSVLNCRTKYNEKSGGPCDVYPKWHNKIIKCHLEPQDWNMLSSAPFHVSY